MTTFSVRRMRATIALAGDDGVERPSPGAAPSAFRIWKAGENPTSKGMTVFSPRSAALLLADQGERGNLYSIDVDHMSLSDEAPPANHRAVGWHRISVRDTAAGPELWAVDVEWTHEVRSALESTPPGFRYFSPAYDVERATNEVVGYLNTALTNNPATYQVTALATRAGSEKRETSMTYKECIAALAGDDDDKKEAAKRAMRTAFGEGDDEKKDSDGSDDDKKSDDKAEEKKDSDGSDDEKKPEEKKDSDGSDEKKPEEKKDAIAATALDAAAVDKLVDAKLQVIADNAERDRLIASRSDAPAKMLAALKSKPLTLVREMLASIPVAAKRNLAADIGVTATRGDSSGNDRSARLPADEKAALDERMGLAPRRASIRREGNAVVFGVMTNEDAKRLLASKNGGK